MATHSSGDAVAPDGTGDVPGGQAGRVVRHGRVVRPGGWSGRAGGQAGRVVRHGRVSKNGRVVRPGGQQGWARPGSGRAVAERALPGHPCGAGECHDVFMTDTTQGTSAFRAARDLLLRHREDYDAAMSQFSWPELDEFNWALDWFDVIAAEHPDIGALRVVTEDSDTRLSYAELAARSNQVANWLRGLGVGRGDRVLLMLGNIAPLWEVILAAMKLGAVIIPASTLLGPEDLADRIERGDVRHVITESALTPRFHGLAGNWTRIAVGGSAPEGGQSYSGSFQMKDEFVADGPTRATDPLLLYFTSGTTSQPKLVEHTHASYPAGQLSTMYWIGLQPGDVHLNISSPGWAKHAWSNVFAPWIAGATVLVLGHERFSAAALLAAIPACGVDGICAPPTVWRMLVQADLASADVRS